MACSGLDNECKNTCPGASHAEQTYPMDGGKKREHDTRDGRHMLFIWKWEKINSKIQYVRYSIDFITLHLQVTFQACPHDSH